MKWVLGLLIILLILSFLTYPFKIKIMAHFDVFNNIGFILMRFTIFEFVCQKISLNKDGQIIIETKKIPKKKNKKQSEKSKIYYKHLVQKLDIKQIELYIAGGSFDACQTSIFCGTILSIVSFIASYLKSKYSNIKIVNEVLPLYGKEQIMMSSRAVIRFCLLDMIVSIICANLNYYKLKRRGEIG